MTFWPLTNTDFPTDQTFHQFHDLYTALDLHWIMSGFHWAFATGVASQQGTLTLPDTWFRPPFWDLLMLQLLRPNSSNLPCLHPTFHFEYPLVLSRFCFELRILEIHSFPHFLLHVLAYWAEILHNWLQVKFEGHQFSSLFVGVMPLRNLESWKYTVFCTFLPHAFDIFCWNFVYDLIFINL